MNLTSPTVALVRREVRGSLLRWRTLALVVCWIVASLLATVALWPAEMTPGFAWGHLTFTDEKYF